MLSYTSCRAGAQAPDERAGGGALTPLGEVHDEVPSAGWGAGGGWGRLGAHRDDEELQPLALVLESLADRPDREVRRLLTRHVLGLDRHNRHRRTAEPARHVEGLPMGKPREVDVSIGLGRS